MTMLDQFVDLFNDVMSKNRALAIMLIMAGAVGGILAIAGGYYTTYRVITLLSNAF